MLGAILKYHTIPKTLWTEVRSIHGITQKIFKHNDIFSTSLTVRTFLVRCTRLVRPASFLKPRKLPRSSLVRHQQTSLLNINTNVANNVILYKNESTTYFWNVRMFANVQLFCWLIIAYYAYTPTFFGIFSTDIKFTDIKKYLIQLLIFVFSIVVGPIMYGFIYALCARNIKYIILNKGGKTLSFITYHMQKSKSNITVPQEMVKYMSNRTDSGLCIPIKISGRSMYYLIDKKGTFINPQLFDHIVKYSG